jgi:enoyl-CoA hydratase/carnithine racemase
MDILDHGHNFADAMEQSAFADCNHWSNDAPGQINRSRSGEGASLHWRRTADTLVIAKSRAGFDAEAVGGLSALLDAIVSGEVAGLKYLVFDFHHGCEDGVSECADGFEALVAANAELILNAPVISIAWARSDMRGADLEFAMSCSTIVAARGARFQFNADAADSFGLYNALSKKIGFAKAERLLENEQVLSAEEMEKLFLVKEIVEKDDGEAGILRYVEQLGRRYNASCGIFRAQRMSMGAWRRRPEAVTEMRWAA